MAFLCDFARLGTGGTVKQTISADEQTSNVF